MASQLNQFNWLARHYDQLASIIFGKSIFKAQTVYLCEVSKNANVLILGGGTGKLLTQLFSVNDSCRVWFVEASSKMIKLAKINAEPYRARILFIHGTEDSIPENLKFDVVITHFFLDLFTERSLGSVVEKIYRYLNPGGLWLACDFTNTDKWWQKKLLWVMYLFFHFGCGIESKKLPSWEAQVKHSGMHLIKCNFFFDGFIKSTMFQKN